ncbi:MAG TPA: selenocysteine-specific translation elongation factor [Acidimicrobiales bacterium]|nr:selenocysteine-specific translation elongation factor [Acidimicrobiales bacterium]
MHVVATAGHVDHGKSTLVLALTGMDPDRFAEEKARGLTIDLGFAWTTLPSGREVAFVDVPGHVRFIRNMLAGVGGVDACLFVVAATEAWKPQSEEHLRILQLLGIGHGLIALTKVGLVDADWEELAALEVADRVAGTFLEGAPIVSVDAPTGRGLDDLRRALDDMLAATPAAADRDRPRLWIDRSFAAKGSGTVVTGTLTGGVLAVDDEITVITAARTGKGTTARIRGLQSHQLARLRVGPGHRVAVNLTGVHHDQVGRGDALIRADQWAPTTTFDASLAVLASIDHDVSRRGAYLLYAGSGEFRARVRVLGAAAITPGETGLVRIHLPVALPLLPGDRYILRESGRAETIGGGEVLDVAPILPASKARPSISVSRVVAERGWVDQSLLERLTGERRPATVGPWVVSPEALAATQQDVLVLVHAAGPLGLDLSALDPRQRAAVATLADQVVVRAGRVWPAGPSSAAAADQTLAADPWLAALRDAPWAPPPPDGVDRQVVRELVRRGLVVGRDGVYFAAEAVEGAARVVAGLLRGAPDGVTVADVRTALGVTRKHVLPLLAELDATGVTRRRGDLRIAGPRLPDPDEPER